MPRTVSFICPHHHEDESIALPNSYADTFEGEIPCGAKMEKATLGIKLAAQGKASKTLRVVKLKVVKVPSNSFPRLPKFNLKTRGQED